MIDGNISMEEDTELRDLVVQTLESNGVLAKLRAELRASVYLALEEQEAVANPEPLLNKTVKQYLAGSDGKLLFSLVREFLEYFGLDYTVSVYDSETYFGKEYSYAGRNKLSEKLGIETTEPLLGEILKNSMTGAFAFNSMEKCETDDTKINKANETSTHFANATFEVSVPKIHGGGSTSCSNDNDSSERAESASEVSPDVPINVTITDKKKAAKSCSNALVDTSSCEMQNKSHRDNATSFENADDTDASDGTANNNVESSKITCSPNNQNATNCATRETKVANETNLINKSEHLIKFDESLASETQINQNEDAKQNSDRLQITNNAQNMKRIDAENNFEKTVYFEEIIVDGNKQKVGAPRKSESLLGELPPLAPKSNSIFGDLLPLNGKKTNINDLKELMDIGLAGADNYEEDFVSSASGSANEASPAKEPEIESPDRGSSKLQRKTKQQQQQEKSQSVKADDISEEIDEIEEVFSNASCVSDQLNI